VKKIMGFSHLIKNPLVFGAIVGVFLCILLFLHDKFLSRSKEDKSSLGTYFKLFFAGFIVSAPLVFLLYNRDLSFKEVEAGSGRSVSGGAMSDVELTSSSSSSDSVSEVIEEVAKKVGGGKQSAAQRGGGGSGNGRRFKTMNTDVPNM
jgi:hypothetical protein